MPPLRVAYLLLAIWGAVHPTAVQLGYLHDTGLGLGGLVQGWLANGASRGLTLDLMITALTLTLWIAAETRVRRNWGALLAIPATVLAGPGCGLPLYLFLRSAPIR